jgi:hypothetical protein
MARSALFAALVGAGIALASLFVLVVLFARVLLSTLLLLLARLRPGFLLILLAGTLLALVTILIIRHAHVPLDF